MERKQYLEIATKLINERMNAELNRWADEPEKLRTYAIRYSEYSDSQRVIQPTHESVFYTIEEYIDIALVCQLSFYVDIQPNQDNKPAPTLHIY